MLIFFNDPLYLCHTFKPNVESIGGKSDSSRHYYIYIVGIYIYIYTSVHMYIYIYDDNVFAFYRTAPYTIIIQYNYCKVWAYGRGSTCSSCALVKLNATFNHLKEV